MRSSLILSFLPTPVLFKGIEFSERLSYYGIASNLIIYLNKVLHQELKTAAKNVNDWVGVTTVVPLVGGFLADAYVGRFWMVLISSIIYLLVCFLLFGTQMGYAFLLCFEISNNL